MHRPLPILFQDDDLVAVHKPAGLLVHRTELDRASRVFALQLLRNQLGRRVYPAHRLDRGTSGVLLFGLRPETGQALGAMFEGREVEKSYLAIVRGQAPEQGEIDHPLARRPDERVAAHASTGTQAALTRFRRLAAVELPHRVDRYPTSRYALLELEPVTGRRHQLRRHLKHASHPIIGDATYGKARHNRLFEALFGCRRLLLACVEVRLPHPVTGEPLTITAPLAEDFAAVVRRLGWCENVPARWLARAEEGEPL